MSDLANFAVYRTDEGQAYLRIRESNKTFTAITNDGKTVNLVVVPQATVKSRLQIVPGATILDAARILLSPLSKSVTISPVAKSELEKIVSNKEIIDMATKKKAAKKSTSTSTAAKKSVAKKSNGGVSSPRNENAEVKLVSHPKESDKIKNRERTLVILDTLKKHGGKMKVPALLKAIDGKVNEGTKRTVESVWAFYRSSLVNQGFIKVAAAE